MNTATLNTAANEILAAVPHLDRMVKDTKSITDIKVRISAGTPTVRLRDTTPHFSEIPWNPTPQHHRPVDDLMFIQGVIDRGIERLTHFTDYPSEAARLKTLESLKTRIQAQEFETLLTQKEISVLYGSTEYGSSEEIADDVNNRIHLYHGKMIDKYGEESPHSVVIQERCLGIAPVWTPEIAEYAARHIGAYLNFGLMKLQAANEALNRKDAVSK